MPKGVQERALAGVLVAEQQEREDMCARRNHTRERAAPQQRHDLILIGFCKNLADLEQAPRPS